MTTQQHTDRASARIPTQTPGSPGLLTHRDGRAAHVVLNRPRSINALDHATVRALTSTLAALAHDSAVGVVVLSGTGDRGLCAGGDLVFLHSDGVGAGTRAMSYWSELYALTHTIATYPKPFVAVLDGITFGGGLGLSARAGVRVVTERSTLAMPETRIGFFPDTGGLSLLAGLPGQRGTYLGMCAERVGPADAIALGLADHHVPSDALPAFLRHLAAAPWQEAIAEHATAPGGTARLAEADWIEECFIGDDAVAIRRRLAEHHAPEARTAGLVLDTLSPTAVTLTLLGLRKAARLGLAADLALELRLADALRRSPDFIEGIRARVVDKDRSPTWRPAALADVDAAWLRELVG